MARTVTQTCLDVIPTTPSGIPSARTAIPTGLDARMAARTVSPTAPDASPTASVSRMETVGPGPWPILGQSDAVGLEMIKTLEKRRFTTLGLVQPGVKIVRKVLVILKSDHEAGSAPMLVERPLAQAAWRAGGGIPGAWHWR